MPANCQLLFSVLIKMATFDLVPVDPVMDFIAGHLSVTDDSHRVENNFKEFGFETTDPIQNLGIISLACFTLIVTPPIFRCIQLIFSFNKTATHVL